MWEQPPDTPKPTPPPEPARPDHQKVYVLSENDKRLLRSFGIKQDPLEPTPKPDEDDGA